MYKANRERLLRACYAYLEGSAAVGADISTDVASEEAMPSDQTSQGFQLVFKDVLPRLELALQSL